MPGDVFSAIHTCLSGENEDLSNYVVAARSLPSSSAYGSDELAQNVTYTQFVKNVGVELGNWIDEFIEPYPVELLGRARHAWN